MTSHHIAPQIHHPELRNDNTLHVVAVVSNPERYHSRYRLARDFIERMEATPNVRLHLVEAAFGDRQHELVEQGNDRHLALRINTNAWIKENLINVGVRYLVPREAKYIAWIDADVEFRDKHWAQEALHQLQHFPVIQPWQHCADLGHYGAICQTHTSFGFLNQTGVRQQKWSGEPYPYGHSGFAWACTRAFWEQAEGLLDCCILGSADHHMAWSCVGQCDSTIHKRMAPSFFRRVREWQGRVTPITHREVGFSVGRIEHSFHGPKKRRYYRERWQILVDHGFDPDTDLRRDPQGVIHITKPALEAAVRKYNRSRFEDSIEEV